MWDWIKDFQTLVASLIGISAAVATVAAVWLHNSYDKKRSERQTIENQRQIAQFLSSLMGAEYLIVPQALRAASLQNYRDWFNEGRISDSIRSPAFLSGTQMFYEDIKALPRELLDGVSLFLWTSIRLNSALATLEEAKLNNRVPDDDEFKRLQAMVWMAILVGQDVHRALKQFASNGSLLSLSQGPAEYMYDAKELCKSVNCDFALTDSDSDKLRLLKARFPEQKDFEGELVDISEHGPNKDGDT